ncbi:unnamed protein product [Agarophyton chilense]
MHQEQQRRKMFSSLRACCPSPQSPCLSASAMCVFIAICVFHFHRLAASDSDILEQGLRNLVLPGSLHAADPPLSSPLDAGSLSHHTPVSGASPFSHHSSLRQSLSAFLHRAMQQPQEHVLASDLLHGRSPRALMRIADRLYPMESQNLQNQFSHTNKRGRDFSDRQAAHTHTAMGDSVHNSIHPTGDVADAVGDSVHHLKKLDSLAQEASRRHPVIEAIHSIIGKPAQTETVDRKIHSFDNDHHQAVHMSTASADLSEAPAHVRATDLNIIGSEHVSGNGAALDKDSIQVSDKNTLVGPEERVGSFEEGKPLDVDASSSEWKQQNPTIHTEGKRDGRLSDAPDKGGILSFLWGSSHSEEAQTDIREKKDVAVTSSVLEVAEVKAAGNREDSLSIRRNIDDYQ